MSSLGLRARGVTKQYRYRPSWWKDARTVVALDKADLAVNAGESIALVGRSGSGKSTLGRILSGLEAPDSGEISYPDSLGRPSSIPQRAIQLILPDPARSLNPRWTLLDSVAEPLRIAGADHKEQTARAREALQRVDLPAEVWNRRPQAVSGGQRQRAVLARALAVPDLSALILDEPFTGLDWESRTTVTTLLDDIRRSQGLTLVLITHDVGWVAPWVSRIVVLDAGRVVEDAAAGDFLRSPKHPASAELVGAMLPARENS